jgi:hypothetical protein
MIVGSHFIGAICKVTGFNLPKMMHDFTRQTTNTSLPP